MKKQYIHLVISIILILSVGIATGITTGYYLAYSKSFPELKIVEEVNSGISTIKLLEVKNGELIGKISGRRTRIAYSPENILELEPESDFTIPLSGIHLSEYYQASDLPENTLFIASSKGKYYYSIFDKRAFNITEDNRLYFTNKEEAEQSGFLAK